MVTSGGERVAVYIDGYNLYFGLNDKGWRRYLWLDLVAFARRLVREGQDLVAVKYFTARVGVPRDSARRQGIFLDALRVRGGLEIILGNFIYSPNSCTACGGTSDRREEKQTDVNIAVQMLLDAEEDLYDIAILVSGDSDQVPTVKAIRARHPGRKVVIAFPPMRVSKDLQAVAAAHFVLGRKHFAEAQLPQFVQGDNGYLLFQPAEWWAADEEVS